MRSMPGVRVKIGKDDEILVKGRTVMKGYYKKPEETAKVFENGWFKTGDAGTIDAHGHLTITDRIKDLMKTAGGKYVAPQHIESILTNDDFIENAILIGDDKPYVSALLVPNIEVLREYAQSKNLKYHSIEELLKKSYIREILKVTLDPHVITFAEGLPNRELFPARELTEATNEVFRIYSSDIFPYSNSEGYIELRNYIV